MEEKALQYWKKVAAGIKDFNYRLPSRGIRLRMSNAEKYLISAYQFCLAQIGKEGEFEFTPELKGIAEWLTDNEYKGLLLYGQCGRGKTFVARYVLPLIINATQGKIISYYDMTDAVKQTDKLLHESILILDDVGTEQQYNDFGTIRNTLDEVVDKAEKYGHLLIITTNLTKDEIINTYGERVYDRITKITKRIKYEGKSFRQQD